MMLDIPTMDSLMISVGEQLEQVVSSAMSF